MRHTTFRFSLDPAKKQQQALVRHAGASRFAYNQCLRLLVDSLAAKESDPSVDVPWSGYDLINEFNRWKRSEAAGRMFAVGADGTITKQVTGLAWRHEVSAEVFEEAAVDLGRALAAFSDSRSGTRMGHKIGFPRPKRKGRCKDSFRLRNRTRQIGRCSIRIGEDLPRSVVLPTIGTIRVYDDTRRLRRLLRPVKQFDSHTGEELVAPRARILFATVACRADRWYISLTVHAPDLHAQRRHQSHGGRSQNGFVGVDRGNCELVVCDRWFPSTKTCHACGTVKDQMSLGERTFHCDTCGLSCDRDRNAAANLAAWAEHAQAPRTAKRAAGSPRPLEGKALTIASAMVEPTPAKGEPTLGLIA